MAVPLKSTAKGMGPQDPRPSNLYPPLPPPRLGCGPGGTQATTQHHTSPSLPPFSPPNSRGVGFAVTGPTYPEDRVSRAGNGSPTGPQGTYPRETNPTTARRDLLRQDDTSTPPQRGNGSNTGPLQSETQCNTSDRAKLKIASFNIKGRTSGDINKWLHLPQMMREKGMGILAVQEAHMTDELATQFEGMFGNKFALVHSPDPATRNARGVAFVLNKKLLCTDGIRSEVLVLGRALLISTAWKNDTRFNILNIYAPNAPNEAREFWKTVHQGLRRHTTMKPNVMMGDFNLVEDALDHIPSGTDDQQATELLQNVKSHLGIVDGWRLANGNEKGYTWSRETDGTQSRLDRIYIHSDLFAECTDWKTSPPQCPLTTK